KEMLRMRDLGINTPTGVPYTEEQIMAMVKKSKQRGHIPGIDEIKEDGKRLRKELELLRSVVRSDDRSSQMLTQLESQPKIGGRNGSGGGGDDEPGGDEDAGGDEEI
ncbi:hypothetical protein Tco_0762580, partial [Tanacetum coccineum]